MNTHEINGRRIERRREQETIYAIKHAAVTRYQVPRVLGMKLPFDPRFEKVAAMACERKENPERQAGRGTTSDQP